MSADEFDPMIERLFSRSPHLPDAALFAAGVETRLDSGSRIRTLALTLAGLVGGVIAVRESLNLNLNLGNGDVRPATHAIQQGVQVATTDLSGALVSGLNQLGLADMSLGSMGGMQLFWLSAGLLIALATAGVMKLSQEG